MGISRDSVHKRRLTGGKQARLRGKRKYELGRQSAHTKLGSKLVRSVRVRGGNKKLRAIRLDAGNFSWATEGIALKSRILNVVYNASNNELVRTNTLCKGTIVLIDATRFRQWYAQHYGVEIGKRTKKEEEDHLGEETKSAKLQKKLEKRRKDHILEKNLADLFSGGKLYAKVSSRPGQSGRCDGYILEGKELDFYMRQMAKKKKVGK